MTGPEIPRWRQPIDALSSTRFGSAFLRRVAPHLDRPLMRLSRGRFALTFGLPTLLLTTIGRKSGEPRSSPLLYLRHGESLVVFGTRFGSPRQPDWYLNIQKTPEATVTLDGEEFEVTPRDATPEEREELWARATRMYGGFEKYGERVVGRQIPIVLLTRVEPIARP